MGLAKAADPKLKAAKMQLAGRLQAHLPLKLSLSWVKLCDKTFTFFGLNSAIKLSLSGVTLRQEANVWSTNVLRCTTEQQSALTSYAW